MPKKIPIGLLHIETDWDFGIKLRNELYADYEETIKIYSIKELKNLEYTGPFGAPVSEQTKLWEVKEAISAILNEPKKHFSNLGGNRGANWSPL